MRRLFSPGLLVLALASTLLVLGACGDASDAKGPTKQDAGPRDRGASSDLPSFETGVVPPEAGTDGGAELGDQGVPGGPAVVALFEELAKAKAGDIVTIDSDLLVNRAIEVPAGITLRGASPKISVTTTGAGAAVIAVTDDESLFPTKVEDLTLAPVRGVGLLVKGNGTFEGKQLQVNVTAGVGIAIEGPKIVKLSDSRVRGTTSVVDLASQTFPVESIDFPVIGLAISGVGDLQLTNVDVEDFIGFGALLSKCNGSWKGGMVLEHVGVGLFVRGGDLLLSGLRLDRNAASTTKSALPTVGLIIADGAKVQSVNLDITQNEGMGLLQADGASQHDDLLVADSTEVGVRVQDGGTLVLRKSTVTRSHGVGIFAEGAGIVELEDSVVRDTKPMPGAPVADQLGDGLEVVMPATTMKLTRVSFIKNHRAACVLHGPDPGARTHAMVVDDVDIDAGGAYGLIVLAGMKRWLSWDYEVVGVAGEGTLPPTMKMAHTAAIPHLGPLTGSLIGPDTGQISPTGGVRFQIGAKGLDPGLGP